MAKEIKSTKLIGVYYAFNKKTGTKQIILNDNKIMAEQVFQKITNQQPYSEAADFDLYQSGEFNSVTGLITAFKNPDFITTGKFEKQLDDNLKSIIQAQVDEAMKTNIKFLMEQVKETILLEKTESDLAKLDEAEQIKLQPIEKTLAE